ncbi:MAG: RDD family protein [Rickettsiales bacterium]|nr:RDD family protein [Rickettsiales bacterium]
MSRIYITQHASVQKRVIAFAIDTVIITSMLGLPDYISSNSSLMTIATIISIIFSMAYYILMHGWCGSTIGKLFVGIKVVSHTGKTISYLQAALRYSVYSIALILILLGTVLSNDQFSKVYETYEKLERLGITEERYNKGELTAEEMRKLDEAKEFADSTFEESDIGVIGSFILLGSVLYFGFGIIDTIIFLITQKTRALHDMMAGTHVVDKSSLTH